MPVRRNISPINCVSIIQPARRSPCTDAVDMFMAWRLDAQSLLHLTVFILLYLSMNSYQPTHYMSLSYS